VTLPTSTYQEQAFNFIKMGILTRSYKPGEYITDKQIADSMNISRTPVREAFHRLANEGLLINEARRGWRVYSLSLDDIHEIFDIKTALEGMLAGKAAQCQDGVLRADLQAALEEMEFATSQNDTEAWFAADEKLHNTIFSMAQNERAERTIRNLNDQWHRLRIGFAAMQSRMTTSIDEHKLIAKSILDGDADAADQDMQDHLNRVRDDLARLLENLVLPFVENGV
jgi:DNA-binding GntR family transcriptional regulator